MTGSMRSVRKDILQILKSAVKSVRGDDAIASHVHLSGGTLQVDSHNILIDRYERIFILGAGKALAYMARGLEKQLDGRVSGGLVSVKYGHSIALQRPGLLEAGHPTPDANSLKAARATMRLAQSCGANDLAFCLLSGGASSLWCLPCQPLELADKAITTEALLRCGAGIHEINTVRKHLSAIKGGRLARAIFPARHVTLAISDVIGDDMTAIGSGPTVADPTTFGDSRMILEKYNLISALPDKVIRHINSGIGGHIEESPKPHESFFEENIVCIVASNRLALRTAQETAGELGYGTQLIGSDISGEARQAGKKLARKARQTSAQIRQGTRPVVLLAGGETTVTVTGHGRGGRNQELALSAAIELKGIENVVLASIGTDGTDGPTDAAGGIVDGSTVDRGQQLGMDAAAYLADNNAYAYLDKIGDLIRTGPTGTNVMDLQVMIIGEEATKS
jgi:hydroxypyruvate reductase